MDGLLQQILTHCQDGIEESRRDCKPKEKLGYLRQTLVEIARDIHDYVRVRDELDEGIYQ